MPLPNAPNIQKLQANRNIKGLIRALEHPDQSTREQATLALVSLGASALQDLRQALQSNATNVSRGVAITLAKMSIPQAIQTLEEGLKNTKRLVRLECARGMGQTKSPTAIPILQEHLSHETDPEIRVMIFESLTHLGSPEGLQALFKLLESNDPNLRIAATQSLSTLGETVIDHLINGLKAANATTRYACANALGSNRSPRAIVPLIQTLIDEDEGVQRAAQETLLQYETQAAQYLSLAIKTKDQRLQQAVIRALKKMPQFAEQPLITSLFGSAPEQQENTIRLLGQIGTKASIAPLAKLIQHPDSSIRYSVVEALASLGFEACIPYLVSALKDVDDYIQMAAHKGLTCIRQETFNLQIAQYIDTILLQASTQSTPTTKQGQVNLLIEELKKIAQSDGFIGEQGSQFDSLSRHIRTREIGMQLYQSGGHLMMQAVWGALEKQLDPQSAADLMANWKEIGGWNAI